MKKLNISELVNEGLDIPSLEATDVKGRLLLVTPKTAEITAIIDNETNSIRIRIGSTVNSSGWLEFNLTKEDE